MNSTTTPNLLSNLDLVSYFAANYQRWKTKKQDALLKIELQRKKAREKKVRQRQKQKLKCKPYHYMYVLTFTLVYMSFLIFAHLLSSESVLTQAAPSISKFEEHLSTFKYTKCEACLCVRLNMKTIHGADGIRRCHTCNIQKHTVKTFSHPIWLSSDGTPQYHVPFELEGLSEGEKLLLQQISPYVPLQHLQKGSFGCKGHVCSFPQDINQVCLDLPRLPTDASIVNVVKHFRDKHNAPHQHTFRVRKSKVLTALHWLKANNPVYKHIDIKPNNLDWMSGSEDHLKPPNSQLQDTDNTDLEQYVNQHDDPHNQNQDPTLYGIVAPPPNQHNPGDKYKQFTSSMETAFKKQCKNSTISFPYVASTPVNEYDTTEKIFCKAFPWLFPGGFGDFNDYSETKETVDHWMKRLLYYQDGRFARDKMWSFFALNYSVRKKNSDSGAYFVDGFFENGPKTIPQLQDMLNKGDISWINRLAYYSFHVKGSPGYWRFKRSEVYSWVNHHIEAGHGPPTMFITLSCAEHYWPDINKLIKDRKSFSTIQDNEQSHSSSLHDYAIVVQEYFQQRVSAWLSTVGKDILKIKHHWLRYEFAPGRGQIHAHMLAISDNMDIQSAYYNFKDDAKKQTEILSQWAQDTFAMTASVPMDTTKAHCREHSEHPSSVSFCNVSDILKDATNSLLSNQYHTCGPKCMRKHKSSNTSRVYKCGAGPEHTKGKCDTPGFPLSSKPSIVKDIRGFKRLDLPRNHPRITQTSMVLSQSWRANCDIQILIYDSDPQNPDASDVARATDYIVAYACKGIETIQEEKQQMISLVLQSKETLASKADVQQLARKLLNKTISGKMVSKQEAMVLVGQLDLVDCSESVSTVSISGHYKLDYKKNSTFLSQYANRPAAYNHMSLHQYFGIVKNKSKKRVQAKTIIPHYVGASCYPVYPPTPSYARSIIMLHSPWQTNFPSNQDFLTRFNMMVAQGQLPSFVLIPLLRVKARHESRIKFSEPINTTDDPITPFLSPLSSTDLQEVIMLSNMLPSVDNAEDDAFQDLDLGLDYDWSQQHSLKCDVTKATNFLSHAIEHDNSTKSTSVDIPVKSDGTPYDLETLTDEQKNIAAEVFLTIKNWLLAAEDPNHVFQPLQITISGQAGSGKSVLIHTICSAIRNLFQRTDACYVCAPTGSAAFSAGGKTIHSLFGIGTKPTPDDNISPTLRKRLQEKFANIVALIIDERSHLSSNLLSRMHSYASKTFHKGQNEGSIWGNVPIVLLVGDDFQLPSIDTGAFDALISNVTELKSLLRQGSRKLGHMRYGQLLFQEAGQKVMSLSVSKRTQSNQSYFRHLLQCLRGATPEHLSEEDITFLASNYHIMSPKFTEEDRKILAREALFLFATKQPRNIFNRIRLQETHSATNPVARIRSQTTKRGLIVSNNQHYDESIPSSITICREAQVSITGCNIMPSWGLFNGSLGTVKDIVFNPSESPNNGQLPQYVLVSFPTYCGPPFDKQHPKLVPIVPVSVMCSRNCCCQRKFIPLSLSFGRTVHTFQGQNAGPVDPGRPQNAVQRIICDPGTRSFEAKCTGLFYTILSRATTIGTTDTGNPIMDSAVYFFGKNMNQARIRNITLQNNGQPYKSVMKRARWVAFLQDHVHPPSMSPSEQKALFTWVKSTKISPDHLSSVITFHSSTSI